MSHLIYTHTHKLLDIIVVVITAIIIPVLSKQKSWVEIPTPVLSSCVFYHKSLSPSVPQFPQMKVRETPYASVAETTRAYQRRNSALSTHSLLASSSRLCALGMAVRLNEQK